MKSPDMDKEEFRHIVVALAFFVVGFAATFVGVYLMISLGAALTVSGLFLLVAAIVSTDRKEPECKR